MIKDLHIPKAIYLYDERIEDLNPLRDNPVLLQKCQDTLSLTTISGGINFREIKEFIRKNFWEIPLRLIRLRERIVQTKGIILDLLKTNKNFAKLGQKHKDICSIILTDKLFATYEDRSLHIRAAIFGFPSIISTSGIIEGPAKPRDYYILKKKYDSLGLWPQKEKSVKEKFKGRFIDYGDQRLNEVIKGFISQGIFFFMTENPFCHRKRCRLYNSHWQEDLIYSQIKFGKFCSEHKRFLEKLKKRYLI